MNINKNEKPGSLASAKITENTGKEVLNRPSEKSTARIIDTDALQAAHLKRMINERRTDRRPAPRIIEVA